MADLRQRCSVPKCRKQFTPRRGTTRTKCFDCSPEKTNTGQKPSSSGDPSLTDGELQRAVRAELDRLDAVGSVAGTVALRLARSLDDPELGAAQVSSISAQLIRTLEPLQKRAPRVPDRMDSRVEAALRLVRGA